MAGETDPPVGGPPPASFQSDVPTPNGRRRQRRAGARRPVRLPYENVQDNLVKTRIAPDLFRYFFTPEGAPTPDRRIHQVIIELNAQFPGGAKAAQHEFINACRKGRKRVFGVLRDYRPPGEIEPFAINLGRGESVSARKSLLTDGYVFGALSRASILGIVALSPKAGDQTIELVYKVWLDHPIERCVYTSARTIKSDAARAAFAAAGKDIVWAVADTGIDGTHPHFETHATLRLLPAGVSHMDFTTDHATDGQSSAAALVDAAGHGTHVAGIIAGETKIDAAKLPGGIWVSREVRSEDGTARKNDDEFFEPISGLAPLCKLVSLKVLTQDDEGQLSSLIAAINYVRRVNDYGRTVKIHGMNLSLGYPFEPIWFAAGQSPLCTEVDLLVRAGVVVVAAAGNGGYGSVTTYSGRDEVAAHLGTINDPGNSALAITVGSTHREWPHNYGVSYFSGKGPTADGRMKPDLVAPGERIVSCSIDKTRKPNGASAAFREDTGTSMAAPHVSGAVAAFISVRTEFIGRPQQVKEILMGAAIDLKRQPEFQGAGLVDVMRALQSV